MNTTGTEPFDVDDVSLTESTLRPSRDEQSHKLTSFAELYISEGRSPRSDDESDPETSNESFNSDEVRSVGMEPTCSCSCVSMLSSSACLKLTIELQLLRTAEQEQSLSEESEVSKILSALNVSDEPSTGPAISTEADAILPEPSAEALRQRADSETWQESENGLHLAALSSQRPLSLLLRESQENLPTTSEAMGSDIWVSHPKHYFILSSSGKPIYSYHGDESSLAAQMALITALVAVIQDHVRDLRRCL
jgi:hypothetical protein